jgi:hypothetical protein
MSPARAAAMPPDPSGRVATEPFAILTIGYKQDSFGRAGRPQASSHPSQEASA